MVDYLHNYIIIDFICDLIYFNSHPLAQEQIDAVEEVLNELDVESIPKLTVWNKVPIL